MTTFTIIQIRSDARSDTTTVSGYAAETLMIEQRKRMEADRMVLTYHIFMDGAHYAMWTRQL